MSRLAAGLYVAAMDLAETVGRGNRKEVAGAEKALRDQADLFATGRQGDRTMNVDTLKQGIRTSILGAFGAPKEGDSFDASNIEAATNSVLSFLEHQPELINPGMHDHHNPKGLRHDCVGPRSPNLDTPTSENKVIRAFWDGNGNATNGKPGLAQFRIYWPDGTILPGSVPYEKKTNNELEYQGLIHSLEILLSTAEDPHSQRQNKHCFVMKDTDVVIMGDSKLVVEQVNGRWRVKEKHLVPYHDKALGLLSSLKLHCKSVELKWVPSSENLVDQHS